MTDAAQTGATPQHSTSHPQDDMPPVIPVAQEKTDGPMDIAEFAGRLDVDPDRDGVKG